MKLVLISTAAMLAVVSNVYAADPYVPPPEEVIVAPTFTWTGPYLGLHGGWAWGDGSAEYANPVPCGGGGPVGCAISLDPSGGFVGGQIGYNYVFDNGFLLGIEGDYSFANLTDSGDAGLFPFASHVDLEVDQMATIQARLGYAMGQWLPFATVGWGFAHAERSVYNPAIPGNGGSDSNWHNGWTVGAGAEYAINEHWSAKGEYRYMDLGDENYQVPTLGPGGTDVELNIHTVRFGINYRF